MLVPDTTNINENDVHCEVDGYSKLAAMKSELKLSYDHVGVVSSGDFVQGGLSAQFPRASTSCSL